LQFPRYDGIVVLCSNLLSTGDNHIVANATNRIPKWLYRGWQSIRADEQPPDFPVFQVQEGETPYRAGITLGVRDAVASVAKKTGSDRWIDDWFDNALRRR
jgi:hypothetical protein